MAENYIVVILSVVGIVTLTSASLRYRRFMGGQAPGLKEALGMAQSGALALAAQLLSLIISDENIAAQLQALSIALIMFANAFIYASTVLLMGGRGVRITRLLPLLYVFPLLLSVVAFSNPWTHLLVGGIEKYPDGFAYQTWYGSVVFIMTIYTSVLRFVITVYSVYVLIKNPDRRKNLALAFLLLAIAPRLLNWSGTEISLAGINTGSLLYWVPILLFFRFFYAYLFMARHSALADSPDGYVVFDQWGDCADCNQRGEAFFMKYANSARPRLDTLLRLAGAEAETLCKGSAVELRMEDAGNIRYFRVGPLPIRDVLSRDSGVAFQINETTETRKKINQLNALATEDVLTGAKNRRYLFDHAGKIMRPGVEITLLMMDIDHFKRINDTFGHTAGDEVLRHFCQRCRNVLRQEEDCLCRYGGEEFMVISKNTDRVTGMELARRILNAISSSAFTTSAGIIPVTVSIGGCSMSVATGDSIEQWITCADQLLYEAKNGGRNRVCYSPEKVVEKAG